jgi:hypothetical protein
MDFQIGGITIFKGTKMKIVFPQTLILQDMLTMDLLKLLMKKNNLYYYKSLFTI